MKKTVMISIALWMGIAACAAQQEIAQSIDCEVFLAPYVETALKEVSGKVVLDAGSSLAPQPGTSLANRFVDLASGMKVGEKVMVAAPASYGVLFTDGKQSDEAVYQHINQVITSLGRNRDPAAITRALSSLKEVMRATFVQTREGLRLVADEKHLQVGQPIWCKTPEGVISTVYHSEEEYMIALYQAGFSCEEIKHPCFSGKVKYDMWHADQKEGKSLGSAYMTNNPFTLYYLVKRV